MSVYVQVHTHVGADREGEHESPCVCRCTCVWGCTCSCPMCAYGSAYIGVYACECVCQRATQVVSSQHTLHLHFKIRSLFGLRHTDLARLATQ